MYDWLLFFHVFSAFLLIGAMVFFWALVLATLPGRSMLGGATSLRLARPATIAVIVGTVGTLIFGVWLAIYVDAYHPWDGWIIASLVLWAISAGTGERSGRALTPVGDVYPAWGRGVLLHGVSSVAALIILILMIWKPGA